MIWFAMALVLGPVVGVLAGRRFRRIAANADPWPDLVDEAFEQAQAILTPDAPPDYVGRDDDMTDAEREAEVRWLKQMFGPPVSPGRD